MCLQPENHPRGSEYKSLRCRVIQMAFSWLGRPDLQLAKAVGAASHLGSLWFSGSLIYELIPILASRELGFERCAVLRLGSMSLQRLSLRASRSHSFLEGPQAGSSTHELFLSKHGSTAQGTLDQPLLCFSNRPSDLQLSDIHYP